MKFLKNASLFFINCSLIIMAVLLPSCSRTDHFQQTKIGDQRAFYQAMTQAAFYEKSDPDSALILTSKALEMMQKLQMQSNDTLYLLLEMKSFLLWEVNQSDSALLMLSDAHLKAKNTADKFYKAKIALLAGSIALKREKYELAGKYLIESITLFEKLDHEYLKAKAYNRYGNLLLSKGDNAKALEYLLMAYKILDKQKDQHELSSVCLSIGNTFDEIGSPEEKLRFYRLALESGIMSNDTLNQINVLVNLGVHYRKILPDSALYFYHRVIELSPPGNNNQEIIARYNIANMYFDQKKYSKALEYYNNIYQYCLAKKINRGVVSASSGIVAVYNKLGNPERAGDFIKTAMAYADSIGDKQLLYLLKSSIQDFYEENENFKEAYLILQEIKAFNDSTQALEKKIALHELEIRYQTENMDAENNRLNLEVANQKQVSKSRYYIIILLFLIALLFIFFSWKGYSLYSERSYAYNVLMQKYNEEKAYKNLASDSQLDVLSELKANISYSTGDPLIENLIRYYNSEKPYLDPKLRVEDVYAKLNTSHKALSAAMKQYNNSNFNTFTNQFRVEEAKKIIENSNDTFYKVEAVAFDSGFGSKSSFYAAFEQFTGVNPSYYRSFMLNRNEVAE